MYQVASGARGSSRPGKRYADFDPRSDHVAEVGLASLVVADGGATRPALAALAAKTLKWILPAVVVLGIAVVVALRRKPRPAPPGSPRGT